MSQVVDILSSEEMRTAMGSGSSMLEDSDASNMPPEDILIPPPPILQYLLVNVPEEDDGNSNYFTLRSISGSNPVWFDVEFQGFSHFQRLPSRISFHRDQEPRT